MSDAVSRSVDRSKSMGRNIVCQSFSPSGSMNQKGKGYIDTHPFKSLSFSKIPF